MVSNVVLTPERLLRAQLLQIFYSAISAHRDNPARADPAVQPAPRAPHAGWSRSLARASRHHKRSTILITNIDFDAWASYLGDAPLATARGTIIARSPNGAVSASSPLTLRAVATRLSP